MERHLGPQQLIDELHALRGEIGRYRDHVRSRGTHEASDFDRVGIAVGRVLMGRPLVSPAADPPSADQNEDPTPG